MNIFQALREDHDKQRLLMQSLLETHGDTTARHDIFSMLKLELKAHAMAEERHFYLTLIESELMQENARHAIAEHHQIDKLIKELETTDLSSSAWLIKAQELSDKVLHHLEEEEHEFFQLAGKVFSEKLKESLAQDFNKEKSRYLAKAS